MSSATTRTRILTIPQVAEGLESFAMESPIKKPVFVAENKENYESDEVAIPVKGIPLADEPAVAEAEVAAKEDDSIEPILQENANRFVLFPIKYHEVSYSRTKTRKVASQY